jgi:osmotically-inducible protein OsmY
MRSLMSIKRCAPVLTLIFVSGLSGCSTANEAVIGECNTAACSADAKITKDVQANLRQHPEFGANRLRVQTIEGVVYLNGTLPVGVDRANAESVALQTPGVTRVVNNIAVSK